jgi:rRNA maturation endonuclease Nob1
MEKGAADELGQTGSHDVVIASNFADQDVLLSLVLFFELLVSSHSISRLIIWFNLLCEECIELSRAHPLVSPLYR